MKRLVQNAFCASKNGKLELWIGSHRDTLDIEFLRRKETVVQVSEASNLPKDRTLQLWSTEHFSVQMEYREEILVTYWKDRLVGIKEVSKYSMEIFKKPIYALTLGTIKSKEDPIWAINWLRTFQNSLGFCCILEDSELNNQQISYILKNSNVTEDLYITLKPSADFQYPEVLPLDLEIFHVTHSHWVLRHHLLSMNCVWIYLERSRLTSHDLNVFLKHWTNGGCPKLKQLSIRRNENSFEHAVVLDGVEIHRKRMDYVRSYRNYEGFTCTIRGGVNIRHGDIPASIPHGLDGTNEFWMVVWPDFTGKPGSIYLEDFEKNRW